MKSHRAVFLLIVLVWTLFPAVQASVYARSFSLDTAAGGETTARLTITNKTGAQFTLKLVGPRTYNILVPIGKLAVQIEKGEYTYEYPACGAVKKGVLEVSGKAKLSTVICKIVKFNVINQTGHPVTLVLDGPARYNYSFDFPPLDARILAGTYKFKVYTSCGSQSGSLVVMGGRRYVTVCPDHPGEQILKIYSRYKK